MKIVKNYLWNVSYQLFVILVPMITMPYISRVLGPSGVGVNSYTNSIAQYFILFGSIGVALYGNRQIAYVRDDRKALTQTFWELTLLRFTTICIALLVFAGYLMLTHKYRNYLMIQSLLILAAAFDISWFFMGVENFRVTVLRSTIVKILSLIFIFVFVRNQNDTGMYVFILALSTLLGNLTLFPYLKRYIDWPNLKDLHMLRYVRPSLELFVPQIAIQVYVVLNKTMLGSFINVDAAGFYDNTDKIIRVVLAVVTATGTVLLPHIANQFAKGEIEGLKKTFRTSFDFVSVISVPLAFGVAAIANKFAILYLGHAFAIVGNLLMIESIAALFIAWDNALGQQYLLPTNQTGKYTKAVIVGAVVNIVFNIPLILQFGVIGSMWATVLSEIAVTAVMLWQVRTEFSLSELFGDFPKSFIAGLVMFVGVRLLDGHLGTSWLSVGLEILLGVVIYTCLILILKPRILSQQKLFNNK
jgi:O-antigen/teichoic acid export membrane protein